ncbi:MAG: HEAT repeat domain-containing protein, partial [Thermoanaerobaculia bacterium]
MRTVAQSAASSWDESVRLLCSLPGFSEWERVEAVAELVRSTSPAIRRRALRLGADVLPDDLLVSWLREGADDVVRNAGLEILKLRGGRAFSLVRQLAFDTDSDVALQAALLIDHYRDPRGVAALKTLLDHGDTNVVQAAIVGLGHHHDPSVVRNLARFLDADVWLQIAAIQALGDIGDPSALPLLEPLLADEFLETFASEAIAHIGSADSFRTLAAHWRPREASVDGERYLSLLASVMVQLPERFFLDRELEASVVRQLNEPGASLRAAAATLLLASGSISHERASLEVLAQSADASSQLPACLSQRSDLTSLLLERFGVQREWGLQLAARYPGSAAAREVADAVLRGEVPEHLAEACSALAQSSSDAAASAVIAIFGRVEPDRRCVVHPAIARH